MQAEPPASSSSSSIPEFNTDWLAEKLGAHQYTELCTQLDTSIDVHRDPRAINWVFLHGHKRGHVFALYKFLRNLMKHRVGRVPSMEDVKCAARCSLLLLLRVAQDVRVCRDDMAKAGLEFVYTSIRDKLRVWMLASASQSPAVTVAHAASELDGWLKATPTKALPLPAWATAFGTSMFGATFTWGNPSATDLAAFTRCSNVSMTRDAVAVRFLTFVQSCSGWPAVFDASLADLS